MAAVKVLILGASGMLGNAALRLFAASPGFAVAGAVRSNASLDLLPESIRANLTAGFDAGSDDSVRQILESTRPDVVINCVGVVKQLGEADNPLVAIPVNALLPHRLLQFCRRAGARLVHVSTDCVFSGAKGMYSEHDWPDARDLYGRSKLLGEVDADGAVTLRTSMIGPELRSPHGLLGWFLSQPEPVKGFKRAVFSGLPTVELARVIRDFVIPKRDVRGVLHVSADPINKHDLLTLIAQTYGVTTGIVPDETVVIDRSLDSSRFRSLTGYAPPPWPDLVRAMNEFG